jgi:hypothetical protein
LEDLTVNDPYLPLCCNEQVFDGAQMREKGSLAFMEGLQIRESHGVVRDHGDQVWVDACKE